MITEMLVRLCHERGVATEADMLRVIREIDLEDGVEDGKWARGQPPPDAPTEERTE
jgi:hypothetical protein